MAAGLRGFSVEPLSDLACLRNRRNAHRAEIEDRKSEIENGMAVREGLLISRSPDRALARSLPERLCGLPTRCHARRVQCVALAPESELRCAARPPSPVRERAQDGADRQDTGAPWSASAFWELCYNLLCSEAEPSNNSVANHHIRSFSKR